MLTKRVSSLVGLKVSEIEKMAQKAPVTYKRFKVPKDSGGERVIYQPSRETKSLQYAIIEIELNSLRVHDIATAYRPGLESPQRKTAAKHAPHAYSLRIDYESFFYSIKPDDLFKCLENNEKGKNDNDKRFLENTLFVEHHGDMKLAIGAPSSPFISNSVVYNIDRKLFDTARAIDADSSITRYADDIVFSTDEKGSCAEFLDSAKKVLENVDWPNLQLNDSKTTFMSRGTKRMVAGLILTPQGEISIGRDKKRAIRSLINDFKYGNLNQEEVQRLQGYMSWIKDVEPELLNRLSMKYTSSLVNRAMRGEV